MTKDGTEFEMNDDITRGLRAYEARDFEAAASLLAQGIEGVTDTEAREHLRIRLASAYDELGRYAEALAEFFAGTVTLMGIL